MLIDGIVLVVVAILSLQGALSGALLMGMRLVAWGAAALLAKPAGSILARALEGHVPFAQQLSVAIAGAALLLLFSLLARFLARGLTEDRELRAADRAFGALAGGVAALVVCFVALVLLLRAGVPLDDDRSLALHAARFACETAHGGWPLRQIRRTAAY